MAKMPVIAGIGRAAGRLARAGALVLLLMPLGGCATNLTGFEFPSFGLFSDGERADLKQTGAVPQQSLSAASGI